MPRARSLSAVALAVYLAFSGSVLGDEAPGDFFTRTGVFRALVSDDFAAAKSSLLYELETDEGEVLPLRFATPPLARTGDEKIDAIVM